MKKTLLSLSVLALAGSLYAGAACCATEKKVEKKKACTSCEKAEAKCGTCSTKKATDKVESKVESKD